MQPVHTFVLYLAIATWVFILAHRHFTMQAKIVSMFGGKVLNAFETPRPSTSMLLALDLQGIRPKNIDHISMMTYDLTEACIYFEQRGAKFSQALNNNGHLEVDVYGSGEVCEHKLPKNFTFHQINHVLEEHINMIETENKRRFVWYEPVHSVKDGRHELPKGAFLVEIDSDEDWAKVEAKFESALAGR